MIKTNFQSFNDSPQVGSETRIELKLETKDLYFWHTTLTRDFESACDVNDVGAMDRLNDIRVLDELLRRFEEIMEYPENNGSVHLTTYQIDKLLSIISSEKLFLQQTGSAIEEYRQVEKHENELKLLAIPHQRSWAG